MKRKGGDKARVLKVRVSVTLDADVLARMVDVARCARVSLSCAVNRALAGV